VVPEGGGEVDRPSAAQHADGEVGQGRHDVWAGAGSDLGGVLGEGGVAEVVQAILDRPVSAEVVGESGGASLLEPEASLRSPQRGGPFRGENRAWLPADVVAPWSLVRPWASRTLGAALWALHCCFEHAD
jgi:hypothetical protein